MFRPSIILKRRPATNKKCSLLSTAGPSKKYFDSTLITTEITPYNNSDTFTSPFKFEPNQQLQYISDDVVANVVSNVEEEVIVDVESADDDSFNQMDNSLPKLIAQVTQGQSNITPIQLDDQESVDRANSLLHELNHQNAVLKSENSGLKTELEQAQSMNNRLRQALSIRSLRIKDILVENVRYNLQIKKLQREFGVIAVDEVLRR